MKSEIVQSSAAPWRSPEIVPVLGCDEVHVWRAALDRPTAQIQRFRHLLAGDERERADRFHFEKDRSRFIAARGILRALLGSYLKTNASRLIFNYGEHGKPALAGDGHAIRFNVSHSDGIALYAFARRRDVGIDVERVRYNLAVAEVAEQFFAPGEIVLIRALPPEARFQTFFRCWTRKEAYVKARGDGLSFPLDKIDFSEDLSDADPKRILRQASAEVGGWSFRELVPAPGYIGALVVEPFPWRLACWQWPSAEE